MGIKTAVISICKVFVFNQYVVSLNTYYYDYVINLRLIREMLLLGFWRFEHIYRSFFKKEIEKKKELRKGMEKPKSEVW